MEDALARVRVAGDELAAERRQEHVLLRRVDELEQLGGLDHEDRAADLEPQRVGQLEDVDAVAVVVHDFEQADDLADVRARAAAPMRGRAGAAARRLSGRWISVITAWMLVDQREERRVAILARMRQRVDDHLAHACPGWRP